MWTPTNTRDSVPRNVCTSSNHAVAPRFGTMRVANARPQTMLAVTIAHATRPLARAVYHQTLPSSSATVTSRAPAQFHDGVVAPERPRVNAFLRDESTRRAHTSDDHGLRDALSPPRLSGS